MSKAEALGPPIAYKDFDKNYWIQLVNATMLVYVVEKGDRWIAKNNMDRALVPVSVSYPKMNITTKGEVMWEASYFLTPPGKEEHVIEVTTEEVL